MDAIGKTCLKICRLIPLSIGTCIQWRAALVFEELMRVLHGQVREQVKKNRCGRPYICKTDAEIRPESFALAHSALVKSIFNC